MTGDGGLVEVQATAERTPLSRAHLDDLLALAAGGIEELRGACRPQAVGGRRRMKLVLATRNAHKAREFGVLLAPHELVPLPADVELPPETGRRSRRSRSSRRAPPRRPPACPRWATTRASRPRRSAARPGVRSARYAGETATDGENLAKLLREAPRAARWPTSARSPTSARDGTEHVVVGRCTGTLPRSRAATGASATTPCSCPTRSRDGRTMAELAPEEKDAISHRGRAARELQALLSAG